MRASNPEQAPIAQITHKWGKEMTTRDRLGMIFLLIFFIFSIVLFIMAIFGWRYLFGMDMGEGRLSTYINVLLFSFIVYVEMAYLINTTIIKVFPRELVITTKPISLHGVKYLPVSQVKDFRIVVKRSKFGRRVLSTDYSIIIRLHNGKAVRIFPFTLTKEEAEVYLQQIIQALRNHPTDDKSIGGGQ